MAHSDAARNKNAENSSLKTSNLIIGFTICFFVAMVFYAFYLDRRLDTFQETLRYKPPAEFEESTAHTHDAGHSSGHEMVSPSQGQLVYVPAYSHIYHDDGDPYLLTITLSVRNTSVEHEIVVNSVRYFNTQGKVVKSYLAKPLRLPPLATTEFLVERDNATGGSGANFLVEWTAKTPVTEPIIEAVMIDTKGQQGISFARFGKAVGEAYPDEVAIEQATGEQATGEQDTPEASEQQSPL